MPVLTSKSTTCTPFQERGTKQLSCASTQKAGTDSCSLPVPNQQCNTMPRGTSVRPTFTVPPPATSERLGSTDKTRGSDFETNTTKLAVLSTPFIVTNMAYSPGSRVAGDCTSSILALLQVAATRTMSPNTQLRLVVFTKLRP